MTIPPCSALIDDFALLEGEERYLYLIELGQALPPYDDAARTPAHHVSGCVSMVWLDGDYIAAGGDLRLHLRGESDSHIVRGLIAVLISAYAGKTPHDVLHFDIHALFKRLGLASHLTPQRSNGFFSMVKRLHEQAAAAMTND